MADAERLTSCSAIIFIDEFGRSSDYRSAVALSLALLEKMSLRNSCVGLFATHMGADMIRTSALLPHFPPLRYMQVEYGEKGPSRKLLEGISEVSTAIEVARQMGFSKSVVSKAQEINAAMVSTDFQLCTPQKQLPSRNPDLQNASYSFLPYSIAQKSENETSSFSWWEADIKMDVQEILQRLGTKSDIAIVDIGVDQNPPPSLQSISVVYVLLLNSGRIYVGETDNIVARMSKHKVKLRAQRYLVLPLGRRKSHDKDKSFATELEQFVIQQLEIKGYILTNQVKSLK